MEVKNIPTEDPRTDLWRMLSQFTYQTNINKYVQEHGLSTDTAKLEFIAGCIRQAEAYFKAASRAPLDISPLLIYYGATNLLAGATALLTGEIKVINNHGMKFDIADESRIADAKITPVDPSHGALQIFCNIFSSSCPMTNGAVWTTEELFGSIPDLKIDFENCYRETKPNVIPLKQYEVEGTIVERIEISDLERFDSPVEDLKNLIPDFSKSYLQPQVLHDCIILNPKMNSSDIGIYSIFGRRYLQLSHVKNGQNLTPDQLIIMFMSMFSLGYLSRYRPEKWNSFVQSDKTGEKLLIERFLDVCSRLFPNLVLNRIQERRIQFVHEIETKKIVDSYTSSHGRLG